MKLASSLWTVCIFSCLVIGCGKTSYGTNQQLRLSSGTPAGVTDNQKLCPQASSTTPNSTAQSGAMKLNSLQTCNCESSSTTNNTSGQKTSDQTDCSKQKNIQSSSDSKGHEDDHEDEHNEQEDTYKDHDGQEELSKNGSEQDKADDCDD